MGAIFLAFLQSIWPNIGNIVLKLSTLPVPHPAPQYFHADLPTQSENLAPSNVTPTCDTQWAALFWSSTSAKQLLVQEDGKTSSSNHQDSNSHGQTL